MSKTTWEKEITIEMANHGETWLDVESCTLTEPQLETVFDCGYGSAEGAPFTVWTKNRVYFPLEYDGSEAVGSVSRHPDGIPTRHIGS